MTNPIVVAFQTHHYTYHNWLGAETAESWWSTANWYPPMPYQLP